MNEFIEKLIERMEEEAFDMSLENPDCKAVWLDKTIKAVNELAKEYNGGWIPCSERLPDVGVTVLCYWGKSSICENTTSYYYTLMHRNEDNIWISDFGICTGFVLAWQPLPTPYKEGE